MKDFSEGPYEAARVGFRTCDLPDARYQIYHGTTKPQIVLRLPLSSGVQRGCQRVRLPQASTRAGHPKREFSEKIVVKSKKGKYIKSKVNKINSWPLGHPG